MFCSSFRGNSCYLFHSFPCNPIIRNLEYFFNDFLRFLIFLILFLCFFFRTLLNYISFFFDELMFGSVYLFSKLGAVISNVGLYFSLLKSFLDFFFLFLFFCFVVIESMGRCKVKAIMYNIIWFVQKKKKKSLSVPKMTALCLTRVLDCNSNHSKTNSRSQSLQWQFQNNSALDFICFDPSTKYVLWMDTSKKKTKKNCP